MVRGFRLSNHWQGNRRAYDKIDQPIFSKCPRCGQPKLPHRICGTCGYYQQKKKDDTGKKRNSPRMIVDMKKL
jgi:large subunit ribosomal protein L32